MKTLISMMILISFQVFAADSTATPEPKPTSPGQEKVEDIRQNGGALKVQKKPAKVEGLNAPAEGGKETKKKSKKSPKPDGDQ